MGNHRFKLSDMMPNAWFYKLRDMSKPKTQIPKNRKLPPPPPPHPPTQKTPRKSYYHSTESRLIIHNHHSSPSPNNPKPFHTRFPTDPPRKSSKKRAKRKTIYMPSPKQKETPKSLSGDDDENTPAPDSSLDRSGFGSSPSDGFSGPRAADIIINVDRVSYSGSINIDRFTEFNPVLSDPDLELNLPPIVTRPAPKNCSPDSGPRKIKTGPGARRSVSRPGGVRLKIRANQGPKTAIRGTEKNNRGEKLTGLFYSESLAIVKASVDPERDFRDSMLEMIVENNIRASKDLEDLLACYLSLNSNQYHGLIIKAFEQIWFNMPAQLRF